MKSHQAINDALSEWRAVTDAADLAQELFGQLDDDEVQRLALRGFTEEIRAALRRKRNGVPVYSNVDQVDAKTGKKRTVYKQTALFKEADYRTAVRSYADRAANNLTVARALALECKRRLGVQIPLPFGDDAADTA